MQKLILSLVFVLCATVMFAQVSVEEAFRTESASAFNKHFHTNVEMIVGKKDNRYSKKDAVAIMTSFFEVHAVNSFKKVHSGSSRGNDSNYYIGELSTDKGTYRVYIYYDTIKGKQVIRELRIENP